MCEAPDNTWSSCRSLNDKLKHIEHLVGIKKGVTVLTPATPPTHNWSGYEVRRLLAHGEHIQHSPN